MLNCKLSINSIATSPFPTTSSASSFYNIKHSTDWSNSTRAKKIIGVLRNWERQRGHHYAHLVPPLVGKPKVVNLESLAEHHPPVVFVINYGPQEMIDQMTQLGIAVAAVSLRHDAFGQER
ncbi:TroA family protein [Lonsdalea quercina]|uniref:hypothetical protein n=1 Tax=Lonsdalea quercina TaxID=71657 RepID=UPI003976FD5A